MKSKPRLPSQCPSCSNSLKISELVCPECKTRVNGNFSLPAVLTLDSDEQDFVLNFVKLSGNIKDMSSRLGLSYPTVRNMLDSIIEKINKAEKEIK